MKLLHLLSSGDAGGIESLCRDIDKTNYFDNAFIFDDRGGLIAKQIEDNGTKIYDLSKYHRISIKKYKFVLELAKEYDYFIVHHNDIFLMLCALYIKKRINNKIIIFAHSCYGDKSQWDNNILKRNVKHFIFQKVFNRANKLIFVSKAGMRSAMEAYKIDVNKCNVVYNGISENLILKGSNNIIKHDKPYNIIYIGRLAKKKGLDILIDTFSKLSKEYDVKLSIVGNGEYKDKLVEKINYYHLQGKVVLYGQQTDIERYLDNATIFVYPSICEEVFGISIVEAMAYGLPCIANNVGGIPEIIKNKENGFLTQNANSKELYSTIKEVIKMIEKQELDNISNNAKATAKKFSIINTCNNIKKVLDYEK